MNGISQPTMQRTMLRVVMAINRNLKEEYLRMPTEAQLQANTAANVEKYGLQDPLLLRPFQLWWHLNYIL